MSDGYITRISAVLGVIMMMMMMMTMRRLLQHPHHLTQLARNTWPKKKLLNSRHAHTESIDLHTTTTPHSHTTTPPALTLQPPQR